MGKKLKKCDWCQKDKDNVNHSYYAMSPIQPKMEEQIAKAIEKYGYEWWIGLEKDDDDLAKKLQFYDQLTCTVGKGSVCWDCEVKDNQNYDKYRPVTSKEEQDPFSMMKIISQDDVEDIDDCSDWFNDIKERQRKPKKMNLKKENDE